MDAILKIITNLVMFQNYLKIPRAGFRRVGLLYELLNITNTVNPKLVELIYRVTEQITNERVRNFSATRSELNFSLI